MANKSVLCIIGAIGLCVTPTIAKGFSSRISTQAQTMSSLEIMWDWQCPKDISFQDISLCQLGDIKDTNRLEFLVWGDSHAAALAPIFSTIASDLGKSGILYHSCPAVLGGTYRLDIPDNAAYNNNLTCTQSQAKMVEFLRRNPSIKKVFLVSHYGFQYKLYDTNNNSKPGDIEVFNNSFKNVINAISHPDREIILLSDVPIFPISPVSCANTNAGLLRASCALEVTTITQEKYNGSQGYINTALQDVVRGDKNTKYISLGEQICSNPICTSTLNGEYLYRDTDHIRRNLSPETMRHFGEIVGIKQALND